MVKIVSMMLLLGIKVFLFFLLSCDGKIVLLDDFVDVLVLLVMFICNYCLFVKYVVVGFLLFGKDY